MKDMGDAVARVSALAQGFPQLRASESYNRLMGDLKDIETDIQKTRELYNMAVSTYNTFRSQIPQCLFASITGFKEARYFDTANTDPIRDFRTDDSDLLKKALSDSMDKKAAPIKIGMDKAQATNDNKSAGGGSEVPV